MGIGDSLAAMSEKGYSKIFFTNPDSKIFFVKQILAGAFITITMTGMDQEMMQKNISVKRLGDSQKNVVTLGFICAGDCAVSFPGRFLYLYAESVGGHFTVAAAGGTKTFMIGDYNATGDKLFPVIALNYMPPLVSVIFIVALISALFPSADGAITALTSSFCIDIIGMQRRNDMDDAEKKKTRQRVHLMVSAMFLVFVLVYKWINNPSMIGVDT